MEPLSEKLNRFVQQGLFFKSVVEDGSDIIFVTDHAGIIHYHNNPVRELLGYAEGLIGRNFLDFVRSDADNTLAEAFRRSASEPNSRSVEFQFRSADGSFRFFEFNSFNLQMTEGIDGLILDCRDITQRKKDAAELLLAQQAKEQFMANISHEIRTPINGIAGIASLLSESTPPEQLRTYLNAIRSAAENLKVIINDILDVSRIESGKLRFEKIGFNLEDLLSSLESTFAHQARSRGISLTFTQDPDTRRIYYGDPVRLNQILINLIGNALKFTQQGTISVQIRPEKKAVNQTRLRFDVKDTGIGIAPEKLGRIFERFSQADSSVTRRYGGTGLGLTIVKQLVELQGGEVTVNSVEGLGTVFTVIIPYDTEGSELPIPTYTGASEADSSILLDGIRILLVEDNDINQLYAGSILKSRGAQVEMAENGYIALEKLKTMVPDLVLMDIQMPVMDGFEATRAIRSGPEPICRIPVIAMTANATQNILQKCQACGMNDYLPKPFSPEDLERVLGKYSGNNKPQTSPPVPSDKIDLSYLRRVGNNDQDFISQILESFLKQARICEGLVHEGIRNTDRDAITRPIHKLKPSLTMIGADSMRLRATTIEDWPTDPDGDPSFFQEAESFCRELKRLTDELEKMHPQEKS